MKLFKTFIKLFMTGVICVATIQISAVYALRATQSDLKPAELIVVLPGSSERIAYGCKVAEEYKAENLMLINSTPKSVKRYFAKHEVSASLEILDGGKSRSSFEDIHTTVETAKKNNIHSIILVTSDYHLPRTLFLMHVFGKAVGADLDIQYVATLHEASPVSRMLTFYNETVKLWGSTAEMLGCLVIRQLPLDSSGILAFRNNVKSLFLVNV